MNLLFSSMVQCIRAMHAGKQWIHHHLQFFFFFNLVKVKFHLTGPLTGVKSTASSEELWKPRYYHLRSLSMCPKCNQNSLSPVRRKLAYNGDQNHHNENHVYHDGDLFIITLSMFPQCNQNSSSSVRRKLLITATQTITPPLFHSWFCSWNMEGLQCTHTQTKKVTARKHWHQQFSIELAPSSSKRER